jgi:hypothetical protein
MRFERDENLEHGLLNGTDATQRQLNLHCQALPLFSGCVN